MDCGSLETQKILACPSCGGVFEHSNNSLTCIKCGKRFPILNGVVYFLEDVNDQEQLESWEEWVFQNEPNSDFCLTERVSSINANLKDLKSKLIDSLVLDLGSGALFPTAQIKLLYKPKNIGSMDFSYNMIKNQGDVTLRLLKMSDEGILRIVFDLNQSRLPFNNSVFDVVVGIFTLHHLRDPVRLLLEVKRVLKPTGICWFLEACKPYVSLMNIDLAGDKKDSYIKISRRFDRLLRYRDWQKLFARFFSIKYFGIPPDSYRRAKSFGFFRSMPKALQTLAMKIQFLIRLLFAPKGYEAIVVVIAKKKKK